MHVARQPVRRCRWRCAIASSSSWYGRIDSTGPKISSRAMVMSFFTLREHGGLHVVALGQARRAGPAPPATSVAPSSMPFWIRPWILSNCDLADDRADVDARPADRVADLDALGGRPSRSRSASAWRLCGTSMRVGALHDWPLFSNTWPAGRVASLLGSGRADAGTAQAGR